MNDLTPERIKKPVADLDAILRTPLGQLAAEQVRPVVDQMIRHRPDTGVIEVAAFNSSI